MWGVCYLHIWGPGSDDHLLFLHLLKINASKFYYRSFQLLIHQTLLLNLLLHILNWGSLIWWALRLRLHAQGVWLAWKFNLLNCHVSSGTWHRWFVHVFAFSGTSLLENLGSKHTVCPSFSTRAGVLRSRKVLLHLSWFLKVLSNLIEVLVEPIVSRLLDNLLTELVGAGSVLSDLVIFYCGLFKELAVGSALNVLYATVIAS